MHGPAIDALDLGGLEAEVTLGGKQRAEAPVVEGRERERQRPPVGGGPPVAGDPAPDHELLERLADGLLEVEGLQPGRRDRARRRLPLADLVAVDDEHPGTAAGELTRGGQAGERCAADDDVGGLVERGAVRSALGGPHRHAPMVERGGPGCVQTATLGRS